MGTLSLACALLFIVAPPVSGQGFLGASSRTQDSRPWAVLHSCSYCATSETVGTWTTVASLGECEAKCNAAKSPYMVYKPRAENWPAWPTNCRCDASCNAQAVYPSCEGHVYHKDVSKMAKTASQAGKANVAADSNSVLIDDGSITLSRDIVSFERPSANNIQDNTKTNGHPLKEEPPVADKTTQEADEKASAAYEQEMTSSDDASTSKAKMTIKDINNDDDDKDDDQDDSSTLTADVDKLQYHVSELQDQLDHPDFHALYEPEYSNNLVLLQSEVNDIQDELLGELMKLRAMAGTDTDQTLGTRIHDVAVLQKVVKKIQDELTRRRHDRSTTSALPKQAPNGLPSDVHNAEQAQPRDPEVIMVLLQKLRKHVTILGKDSKDAEVRRHENHGRVHNAIVPRRQAIHR